MAQTQSTRQAYLKAFQLLKDYERRSLAHAVGLPEQVEVQDVWSGIGFRLGEDHLVVAMGEIREIIEFPSLTAVPGASNWLLGVANVRGTLAAIVDLRGFLEGNETPVTPRSRVLLVMQEGSFLGLLVDEVIGMRRFREEEVAESSMGDDAVGLFLSREYVQDGQRWGVFDLETLLTQPDFMQAAA